MSIGITLNRLWTALRPSEKLEACSAYWEPDQDPDHPDYQYVMLRRIASRSYLNLNSLERESLQKKGERLLRFVHENHESTDDIREILRHWFRHSHIKMIAYLTPRDPQGIGPRHALSQDWVDYPEDPDRDSQDGEVGFNLENYLNLWSTPSVAIFSKENAEDYCRQGVQALKEKFPPRIVAIYIGFLLANHEYPLAGADENDREPSDFDCLRRALPNVLESESIDILSDLGIEKKSLSDSVLQVEEEQEGRDPEDIGTFTTLDKILITTVVAAAFGQEGALTRDQVEGLIDEVVSLNSDRKKTLFHRGFFHALFGKQPEFHFPGENRERRLWYYSGVLFGLLRESSPDKCVKLLCDQPDLTKELIESCDVPCGKDLLPCVFRPLLDASEFSLLRRFLNHQIMGVSSQTRIGLLRSLLEEVGVLIRRGKSVEAKPFLDILEKNLVDSDDLPEEFKAYALPKTLRKKAQVLQLEGDFTLADSILSSLLQQEGIEDFANICADMGLIKGGFRSLQAILPRKEKEEENRALAHPLRLGKEDFLKAVEKHDDNATNAHFCLGLLFLLEQSSLQSTAVDHFHKALRGMQKKESSYEEGGIIHWTQLCLAIALLESNDPTQIQNARELIEKSIQSSVLFPMSMWKRVMESAVCGNGLSLAVNVADYLLLKRGPETNILLKETGLATQSRALLSTYLKWLLEDKMPVSIPVLWNELKRLLPVALEDSSDELAVSILDAMEGLAIQYPTERKEFMGLLRNSHNYAPAWDVLDAEFSLAKLYEKEGLFPDAIEVLKNRFYHSRLSCEERSRLECEQILERLGILKLPDSEIEELRGRIPTVPETGNGRDTDTAEKLKNGAQVSVLYIGGNETQESYVDRITEKLACEWPGVKVEFFLPGWSSSWNKQFENIKPQILTSDVIVLSPLVRTQFGRHVRKTCDHARPWFPCTGKGKKSLDDSIRKAALWICKKKYP
jgi:hypothetical protein